MNFLSYQVNPTETWGCEIHNNQKYFEGIVAGDIQRRNKLIRDKALELGVSFLEIANTHTFVERRGLGQIWLEMLPVKENK